MSYTYLNYTLEPWAMNEEYMNLNKTVTNMFNNKQFNVTLLLNLTKLVDYIRRVDPYCYVIATGATELHDQIKLKTLCLHQQIQEMWTCTKVYVFLRPDCKPLAKFVWSRLQYQPSLEHAYEILYHLYYKMYCSISLDDLNGWLRDAALYGLITLIRYPHNYHHEMPVSGIDVVTKVSDNFTLLGNDLCFDVFVDSSNDCNPYVLANKTTCL